MILIDETGAVADGDQLMALLATRWASEGKLAGGALVATVMSNLGLERHLEGAGLRLERTGVGDRYVVERMREGGFNLGGEQSGHIVMTDHATTGDGLMAGLHFLAEMVQTGLPASSLAHQFEPVPQLLRNVRYGEGPSPLERNDVQSAIADAESALKGQGRLLIRKSGTEPLNSRDGGMRGCRTDARRCGQHRGRGSIGRHCLTVCAEKKIVVAAVHSRADFRKYILNQWPTSYIT